MRKANWEKLPDCEHTRRTVEYIIPSFDDTPIRTEKPIFWIGKSGTRYPWEYGGFPAATKHLPKDDYPYTVEYEPLKPRAWQI
jgi:hypothetical protein